jgi:hypothetical protein
MNGTFDGDDDNNDDDDDRIISFYDNQHNNYSVASKNHYRMRRAFALSF